MAGRKAFPLRLNPELYAELQRWAEAEFRSVNGQIEFLLRQAVRRHRNEKDPDGNGPSPRGAEGPSVEKDPGGDDRNRP